MHQQKGKKIFAYLFILLSVGSINNIDLNNLKFYQVKKIEISGLNNLENESILNKIKKINLKNIFFIDKNQIEKIIEDNTLIEKYEIEKKYPSVLNIKIKKTNFLARINRNGKLFLVGSNGRLSEDNKNNKDLPFIFGKPEIKEILKIKKIIDQSKFSYDEVENLYFFPSKRWDIELKNKIIIKLPIENVRNSLDDIFRFLNNDNIKNIKTIDARVKNQIILND